MTQIGVIDKSGFIDPRELAFLCDAWDRQAKEFADAWGVLYTPVIAYASTKDLPTTSDQVRLLTIENDIGTPGALGYHDDVLGLIFARILKDNNAGAGSHEIVEEEGDPTCDEYVPMGDGNEVAKEAGDPVEGDNYIQVANIGGQTRDVPVTNYVLRSWFDPNGTYPFDRKGKLTAPLTMDDGGYMIIRDASGNINDVFAMRPHVRFGGPKAHATVAHKMSRPDSRLLRRLRGRR